MTCDPPMWIPPPPLILTSHSDITPGRVVRHWPVQVPPSLCAAFGHFLSASIWFQIGPTSTDLILPPPCQPLLLILMSHSDICPGRVVRHCPVQVPPALRAALGHFWSASIWFQIGPTSIERTFAAAGAA
jgi:hypothetical protein